MIDLIGDIHGYANKLEQLLLQLGYSKQNDVYAHPNRKVLFLGDYIDRGPQIRETLQIVKSMVDHGHAIALMGNHEYNALCFHFQETEGGHLRKHDIKNIVQHYETLLQFQNKQEEYEAYLDWFKTLPLFYESQNFRAVHACWDDDSITYLRTVLPNNCLSDELIYESVKNHTPLNHAVEQTLKGKEMHMPSGLSFFDKDGNERTAYRMKWWEDPSQHNYHSISVEGIVELPSTPLPLARQLQHFYGPEEKMVFFGHYWLQGDLIFYRDNVACLDYSVAKAGKLVAYRLGDEERLKTEHLSYV